MEQPISRRAWLGALVSGAGALAAACGGSPGVTEERTDAGRVLRWEGDDVVVLVSGIQDRYQAGTPITLNLIVNNQSTKVLQARLRTRLLGRGEQAVVEAEVAIVNVAPADAASIDRELALPRSLVPGEYTVSVEVPPVRVDGRETGRNATLRAQVQVGPPDA